MRYKVFSTVIGSDNPRDAVMLGHWGTESGARLMASNFARHGVRTWVVDSIERKIVFTFSIPAKEAV